MMISVLIGGRTGGAAGFSAAMIAPPFLLWVGRSDGPVFHDRYAPQPTIPMATAKRTLSNDDRLRIALLLCFLSGRKADYFALISGQQQINAMIIQSRFNYEKE